MIWGEKKIVMRAIDYEINQYIDFGLKYFLRSNWINAQPLWIKNVKNFLIFQKKSTKQFLTFFSSDYTR